MIMGLIDLYQATFDQQWLQWAYDLQLTQNELFYDNDNGGFFSVKRDDESILVRLKDGNWWWRMHVSCCKLINFESCRTRWS